MIRCCVPLALALALASVSATASAIEQSAPAQSTKPESETWLTDAEGRQYKLDPIPKAQAVKVDDTHVRTIFGVPAELAREDDQFFYIKVYKIAPVEAPKPATPAPRVRPEPGAPQSQRLRWTPLSDGLPTAGQWREGITVADVAKNGRLAIVSSPARKTLRPPVVFTRDAAAGWKRSPAANFPDRPYDYGDVAVGDLNGDGLPDIVMGVHLRGVIALQAKPGGTGEYEDASKGLPFQERADTPVFSSQAVVLTDCNGDGKLEIVALGEGPRLPTAQKLDYAVSTGIATFTRQADGSWNRKEVPLDPKVFGSGMAAADLDGDGKIDLAIAPGTMDDNKIVFRGDGACGWQVESVDAVRPRSYITSVATGKVAGNDQDAVVIGYTDFATDDTFYGIDLLKRDATGKWSRQALVRDPGRGRIEALATGDLDGDGKADVAAVDGEGQVIVLLNDGHGKFTREQQPPASTGHCGGAGIAIGDVDGDGLGDLVVSFAQEASPMNPGVCMTEGALTAWKTAKAAARPAPAKPTDRARPGAARRASGG